MSNQPPPTESQVEIKSPLPRKPWTLGGLPRIATPWGSYPREVSEILPGLYLSDVLCARRATSDLGITHVVSILDTDQTYYKREDNDPPLDILHISLSDDPSSDILSHFERTTYFISNALKEDVVVEDEEGAQVAFPPRVLVHCMMGMSRSAVTVCAYLVATSAMTAQESLAFVKEKRPVICPNSGFVEQLQKYSDQHFVKTGKSKGKKPTGKVSEGLAMRIAAFRDATGQGQGNTTPAQATKDLLER